MTATTMGKYILGGPDGRTPVPEYDLLKWARWFETADRIVAKTDIGEDVRVSTVFLGLDHRFSFGRDNEQPVLFETLVFGGPLNDEQRRYSTWEEAEAGHESMVRRVKAETV